MCFVPWVSILRQETDKVIDEKVLMAKKGIDKLNLRKQLSFLYTYA